MRFHPSTKKSKKQLLIIWSPIFLLIGILCFVNGKILKRSIVDVNMRSSYMSYQDMKFDWVEFFSENTKRPQLVVQMSPSKYVQFQKERAKKTKDYIFNNIEGNFTFNYYKAKIHLGQRSSNSKIKLFGLYPDHYGDSDGHSFRIKYNGAEGFGKKKVNVLKPITRSYNLDRFLNILYRKTFSGLELTSHPVDVLFNKKDYGIYLVEDFFDKFFIEENFQRESFIFEVVDNQVYFNHEPKDEVFQYQKDLISEIASEQNHHRFIRMINKEKLFGFLALTLILNNNHHALDINLHWYYNPVTNEFEPTIRESKITKRKDVITKKSFRSELISIWSNRNQILAKWLNATNDEALNYGINKALLKMRSNVEKTLQDEDYLDFRQNLLGFKSNMKAKETLFQSNLNQIKIEAPANAKIVIETIKISKDTIITQDLIVSKFQKLVIEEGVTLQFYNSANLFIFDGQIETKGSKLNPVRLTSIDENSHSSIYINTKHAITFDYTDFSNLSALKKGLWQLPSAITMYESQGVFSNCTFSNNLYGDDMVNVFRCNSVVFENCTFNAIRSDALDSDFSNVTVSNSIFSLIGNDGIDGSGSQISVSNCLFDTIEDKAISAGEKSRFNTAQNKIQNSELGLVCKDGPLLRSSQDTLTKNTLDLVVFKKKAFFSQPSVELSDTKIKTNLVEKETKLIGLTHPIYAKNISKKLYGNDYGKATE